MEIMDIVNAKKEEKQDKWFVVCRHPNHNPPSHIYIPGFKSYEHTCPACKNKQTVYGSQVYL